MTQSGKFALGVVLGFAAVLPASAQNNPKVAWNLSVWGPPRAFTAGIETLAKYVEKESGGNFTIKIHYGDALSKGPDNLDNIKLGAFEMAQICTGYHPGKNPGLSVLDLPGLPLADPDIHAKVHEAIYKHPFIVAEFKKWNAIAFMSVLQPQSELMGVGDPPKTMEGFKGMRVRALGGTGDALKNMGAVPTSVPAPGSLQRARARRFPGGGVPVHLCVRRLQDSRNCQVVHDELGAGREQLPDYRRSAGLQRVAAELQGHDGEGEAARL